MNKKAFNLFTALIAFILIALSVMLVHQMTSSERTAFEVIRSIECKSEIKAISDMKRADTFQTFNYLLRYKIASFFGDGSATVLNMRNKSWDDLVKDFQETRFGNRGKDFAEFTVNWLTALYSDMPQYNGKCGTYQISLLEWNDEDRQKEMTDAMEEMFNQSISNDDFLEVIECENGDPYKCPSGAFYITLDLNQLDEKSYGKLPAIEIINLSNGNVIKEIILPKRKFKIYVPVRIFKALAEVHSFAKYEPSTDPFASSNEFGFFSPRIHNELEQMKLGYCDYGYCNPRTNPYTPPDDKTGDASCSHSDSSSRIDSVTLCEDGLTGKLASDYGLCLSGPETYSPRYSDNMQIKLKELVSERVCYLSKNYPINTAPYIGAGADQGLVPVKTSTSGSLADCNIDVIVVTTETKKSKKVLLSPESNPASTSEPTPGLTNFFKANQNLREGNDCPMKQFLVSNYEPRFVGYGLDGSEVKCAGGDSCSGIPNDSCSNLAEATGEEWEYCAGIDEIKLQFSFKETVEKYKVDNRKDYIYKIEIWDASFTPFTAQYNQVESGDPLSGDGCGLGDLDGSSGCDFKDEAWHCTSYDGGGGACVPSQG